MYKPLVWRELKIVAGLRMCTLQGSHEAEIVEGQEDDTILRMCTLPGSHEVKIHEGQEGYTVLRMGTPPGEPRGEDC